MLAMFGMGMQELMIIGVIAVLLFGRKLPEVAKSLGSSYREFRKGLNDLQSQMNVDETSSTSSYSKGSSYSDSSSDYGDFEDYEEAVAPKFEPPPSEPKTAAQDVADGATEAAEGSSLPTGDVSKAIPEK